MLSTQEHVYNRKKIISINVSRSLYNKDWIIREEIIIPKNTQNRTLQKKIISINVSGSLYTKTQITREEIGESKDDSK